MTRRVCCETCVPFWRKAVGKYPGEDVKVVKGTLHTDCNCDNCNRPLKIGTIAFCVSVSTASTPYFKWEHEFIGETEKTEKTEKQPTFLERDDGSLMPVGAFKRGRDELPVNPRANEVCRKCGNHMFVLGARCEFDGGTCVAKRKW
jgi:hypothetical protein